jgi:hypothetical protein
MANDPVCCGNKKRLPTDGVAPIIREVISLANLSSAIFL